jgi:DNA/RNA-binding domain of Phe-tRNA-synthetase-like protein
MVRLSIDEKIIEACPQLHIGLISCEAKNTVSDALLWKEIDYEVAAFKNSYAIEKINKIPAIQATREMYKALGKDPSRYRPSAEALCRRIMREMDLYRINTLVDLINLVSIRTGYSIGGFDADKIVGDITLTVGTTQDEFEGIGRGLLNIEGLPVYKDKLGGIGTPTSDNERTKIEMKTTRLLLIINAYSGAEGLGEAMNYMVTLLRKYGNAKNISTEVFSVRY